jgi:hypothetical protein
MKPKPVDWSAKLTRPLTLKDGTKLVTLEDARRVVLAEMMIEMQDWALSHALLQLLAAAHTRSYADRKVATHKVAIALRARAVY